MARGRIIGRVPFRFDGPIVAPNQARHPARTGSPASRAGTSRSGRTRSGSADYPTVRAVWEVCRWDVPAPVASGARDLASVFRQPLRAAALLGTSAGLPMSYALALAVSARDFGVDVSFIDVFAVYLGGTAVAAASPTPGNVGAVEVALSAGPGAGGGASGGGGGGAPFFSP